MPSIGPTELIIILIVVLLLFGSTRLPKLARSIGEASKEFKKGVADGGKDTDEVKPAADPEEKVVLTKGELDAMLAERESRARKESPPAS